MDIVVRRSVNEIEHLVFELLSFLADVCFVIALVVVRYIWQSHVTFCVSRIYKIFYMFTFICIFSRKLWSPYSLQLVTGATAMPHWKTLFGLVKARVDTKPP